MKPIVIIAEVIEGCIRPVTWELIAAAKVIKKLTQELLEKKGETDKKKFPLIQVIVTAQKPIPLAKKILSGTGIDVLALEIPNSAGYTSEAYKNELTPLIQKLAPSHILAGHTSQGRDFAPGLAVRLNASSLSGVNKIESDGDRLLYSRSILNNTRNMVLCVEENFPVVLTLMPGVFPPPAQAVNDLGSMIVKEISFGSGKPARMVHRKILKQAGSNQALKQAQTIVAAGRGIGERENLGIVSTFARLFSGSALGASRPLVDMGWIGYDHQVGITGTSVEPRLYIACGISGSSQHLAGMKASDWVISINKNPEAPICSHADLCITADVMDFIQAFMESD